VTDIWENEVNMPDSDREVVSVTLKAGTGFDAPWIVFHASSVGEAEELLKGSQDLQALATAAARNFQTGFGGSSGRDTTKKPYKAATEASGDVPPDVQTFLTDYDGTFPFLIDLATQLKERGSLSPGQVAAVRKCMKKK
jgi:hypothetical protein